MLLIVINLTTKPQQNIPEWFLDWPTSWRRQQLPEFISMLSNERTFGRVWKNYSNLERKQVSQQEQTITTSISICNKTINNCTFFYWKYILKTNNACFDHTFSPKMATVIFFRRFVLKSSTDIYILLLLYCDTLDTELLAQALEWQLPNIVVQHEDMDVLAEIMTHKSEYF